ncbi:MAG: ATP-binding protein [Clostridiales Family XIII bacterium]|jgi:Cdc6-like AAA superfamily ATPase|nr:ATP-binding protein [Clostridiales Family XIII bacterium]
MIDWGKIHEGYSGFEKLAFEYVNVEFKDSNRKWRSTKKTRDGNKDAYAIIVGFHPPGEIGETWWMEAKYSSTEKYLARYRLDATIVSSIFHKQISKIIFVTNIDIHSKVISDVRIALQKAIGCEDVYFCTKNVIEYWLAKHIDVYERFFPEATTKPKPQDVPLSVSEDISVYPYQSNENGYAEECKILYFEKLYRAYLKLLSPVKQTISFEAKYDGIELMTESLDLEPRENAVNIVFRFTDCFQGINVGNDGRKYCRLDLFKILHNSSVIEVLLKKKIELQNSADFHIEIQSQAEILSELNDIAECFRQEQRLRFATIYGKSGTGKTYLVNRFMQSSSITNETIFYHNFSGDHVENAKKICDLIFFLLLPYVNPDEIDSSYIKKIRKNIGRRVITKNFMKLVSLRGYPEKSEEFFSHITRKRADILPQQCDLNSRYLFLDNFQNLNPAVLSFLLFLFRELQRKNCPIFFLFAGQDYILDSDFYRNLKSKFEINEFECRVETSDIASVLQNTRSLKLEIPHLVLGDYFPNIIMLIEFLRYIINFDSIDNLDDFIKLYGPFVNGNMGEELVLEQFKNLMNGEREKLLHAIYTNPNGVPIEDNNDASELLNTGLVKLNEQNQLIPFHDIYKDIFRKTHRISKKALGLDYVDEVDKAREKFLLDNSLDELLQAAKRISKLREDERFYVVCHILDGYFQGAHSTSILKNANNGEVYYQLYFDYAYAAVNCSHRYIGYDCFEKIYNEIKDYNSPKMRFLQLDLLLELMNSNYNMFRYSKAMKYYRQFQKVFRLQRIFGTISSMEKEYEIPFICENMRIMIQSSRGKRRSERMFLQWRKVLKSEAYLLHHCIDFHVRYAHTLYTVDIDRAFLYTKDAHELLPDNIEKTSKQWCLVEFQYLYLQFLRSRNNTLIPRIEAITDAAYRDYYSSYRHRNLALCAILYVIGDFDKADERFLRDLAKPRKLRDKLKGFYYETLALHHLAHNNTNEACDALEKAAETFQSTRSYMRVIRHNQKVLKRGLFSFKRMDFYFTQKFERDWYYIDPRGD